MGKTNDKKSEMYTEVFELLSYMDKTIVMKISVEIVLGEFYKIEDLQNVIKEEEAYDTK